MTTYDQGPVCSMLSLLVGWDIPPRYGSKWDPYPHAKSRGVICPEKRQSPRHFLATATAADPKWDLWRIRWQTWHKRVAIVIGTFGDVCRLYIGFVSWIGMNSRVPGVWMCVCVWMPCPWNFIWLDRCVCSLSVVSFADSCICSDLWSVLLISVRTNSGRNF